MDIRGASIRNCWSFALWSSVLSPCTHLEAMGVGTPTLPHSHTHTHTQSHSHTPTHTPTLTLTFSLAPNKRLGQNPTHPEQDFTVMFAVARKQQTLQPRCVGGGSEQLTAAVFMLRPDTIAVVYNLRASSLAKNAGCSLLSTYLSQMLRVSPTADSRLLQRLVLSHPSIRIKNELSFSCICFGKRGII